MRCPLLAFAALAACASTDHHEHVVAAAASGAAGPAPAPTESADEGAVEELTGVLFPGRTTPISIWLEEYRGELVVLEVCEHGSAVEADQQIVKIDARAMERQLDDARLAARTAATADDILAERNILAREAANQRLARAEAAYLRAQRSLEGYETKETEFKRRADKLSQAREAAWLDDQKDELAQLEAMYSADELVDATEEIVLKRSRRDLANTEMQNALSADQRGYRSALTEQLTAEAKREDLKRQEQELEHLRRTNQVEARSRKSAELRSAAERQKAEQRLQRLDADRARLIVQAPSAGILMHGDLDAARAGAAGPRVKRGGQLGQRKDLFLIAEPGSLSVALTISEGRRDAWRDGAAVRVRPLGSDATLPGRLSVAPMPNGTQGSESTFEATVIVEGAWDGLVPGMHATVSLAEQP